MTSQNPSRNLAARHGPMERAAPEEGDLRLARVRSRPVRDQQPRTFHSGRIRRLRPLHRIGKENTMIRAHASWSDPGLPRSARRRPRGIRAGRDGYYKCQPGVRPPARP